VSQLTVTFVDCNFSDSSASTQTMGALALYIFVVVV
jgi:hypothetical protein